MSNGAWIILIGSFVGCACSLVGTFLVLRRMSMLGDAISHSVLFGIVVAFLLSGTRNITAMLSGAVAVGLLTTYLTNVLSRHARLQEDASIGVVFTWLFALGVILISIFARQVDLDQDCVLYGEIAFAPLDRWLVGGFDLGPRAAWLTGGVALADLLFVWFSFRALKTVSFDATLAASIGMNVSLWHYLLMTFVSLTTVASFESVGAILVVAMLVVPANAAFLLVKSLRGMVALSMLIAILSSAGGYLLAARLDGSVSAGMVLVAGAFLVGAILISLGQEYYHLWRRRREVTVPAA